MWHQALLGSLREDCSAGAVRPQEPDGEHALRPSPVWEEGGGWAMSSAPYVGGEAGRQDHSQAWPVHIPKGM
jgi:hypothetical protein